MADAIAAELPFHGRANTNETATDSDKDAAERKRLTEKSSDFLKGVFANIDPRDKTWGWRLAAAGNAGLTAFLGLTTGGTGIIVKSAIEGAALTGFHMLQKGMYSLKERSLKKDFSGAELAEKLAAMQEKHAKGVDKVMNVVSALSAGGMIGSYAALGIRLAGQNEMLMNKIGSVANIDASQVQHAVVDKAHDAGALIAEKADQLRDTPLGQQAEQLVQDSIAKDKATLRAAIEAGQNAINTGQRIVDVGQSTISDVRSQIVQTKQNVEDMAATGRDIQRNVQDVQSSIPQETKDQADKVLMFHPLYRFARFLGFKL